MEKAETYYTLLILLRLMPQTLFDSELAAGVARFIEERGKKFGITIDFKDCDRFGQPKVERSTLRAARTIIEKRLKSFKRAPSSSLQKNLSTLAKNFRLNETDEQMLAVLAAHQTMTEVARLIEAVTRRGIRDEVAIFAAACGLSSREVDARLLAPSSPLRLSGLLGDNDGYRISGLDSDVVCALQGPARPWKMLKANLLGQPARTTLTWDDFSHVARERDLLCKVLSNSLRRSERGVHCLLYGPPGTGKTELCKVIAEHLNIALYSIGEAACDGWEPSRTHRGKALNRAQKLLNGARDSLLLFDEMEDLFESTPFERRSRAFTHRFLEQSRVPMLWTCNNIDCTDPAILRRMSVSLELKIPPTKVRATIWKKTLQENRVEITEREVQELATSFPVAPALAVNSVRVLAGLSVSKDELATAVKGIADTLTPLPSYAQRKEHSYDPALINASIDAKELAETLSALPTRAVSFCFYGPPGSGKSAFARYLAESMGLEVIQKRASDLLSPWVGVTEKNIAKAFEEALQEKALLVLDEADSFLLDRSFAVRLWEISQVNELLARMENCPTPVICTTNAIERLDKASLRRFHFKIEFRYLSRNQTEKAFVTFFGSSAPVALLELSFLTLGDFAVVRKKAEILGALKHPEKLVRMLAEECEAKHEGSRRIGFVSSLTAGAEDGATTIRKTRDDPASSSFYARLGNRPFT